MYKIAYLHKNEQQERDLYVPGDRDYGITAGKLHVGMGISGELNISIPMDNPARSDIECLTDEIIVYRNDKEIWRGRPVTLQIDFNLTGKLTCEGILSYLYDTYYPPFEFEGSPNDLLRMVIENHNSQVEERKRFEIGEITVEDSNDYINRSSIYYNRTLQILEEKFVEDSLGGYFRVRVEDDVRYLDYLTAYNTESTQPVEFGYNLLDIAQNVEYTDIATAVLPLGAKLTDEDGLELDERLTIASVNGGDIYISDPAAVELYGWIAEEAEWDDVTQPQNLYDKGYEYLTQKTSPVSTFQIQAVDLSLIDSELDPISLGDFVPIRVDAFGVNQMVELTAMDIDFLNPADSILNFGTDAATLTGSTNNTSRSLQESMGALSMRVTNLSTNVLNAVYANIETIIAGTITTDYIRAAVADLGYVTADWVQANFAEISYLEATYATILDLNAAFESVELLDADVANIKNVLAGNVGTGDLQTIVLTSENAFIEEAVIVNALMDTVLASVLTAGIIYTDYIKIADNEGQYLWIDGSTLQFKDENGTVRVQIGMDGDGNYNYYLWDENGNLIWDPLGLTEAGLIGNGAIIKDEAVADDANISGYKLNIQEVAQILNENGDLILNATQVIIDGETLDYQLTQITKQIEGLETEGLVKIETYYSLGTADAPYHAPGDDSANARLGKMVLGQTVLGESGSGWTLIQPTPDDGQYVWFSIKGTYLDGSEQWTDPTLLTDAATRTAVNMLQTEFQVVQGAIENRIWMDDIYTVTNELTGELEDIISEQYGQLTILINAIDARVGELTTTVADDYEALNSSITAINLSLDGINLEIENVAVWASESLTELSEQYAQIQIDINNINSDIVSVWAELAENYSTTTQVSSLIDQAVTENSATIMERVAYEYVSQNELGATLSNYYTAADTEALILAQANETSSTILSQVSATYATQDYVTDMLKDLDLEGVTNLETYYCVSDNANSPDIDFVLDEDFSGGDLPDGWRYYNTSSGTFEYLTDSTEGSYLKITKANGASYNPGVVCNLPKAGHYRVEARRKVDEVTTGAYGIYIGDEGWTFTPSDTIWGDVNPIDRTIEKEESYIAVRFLARSDGNSFCLTNVHIESETDWSTDYPTVETGDYLWVRYLLTYNDGTTAWTEPFCATTNLSDYPTVSIMTSTIQQYVDESQAYILSEVSAMMETEINYIDFSDGLPDNCEVINSSNGSYTSHHYTDGSSELEFSSSTDYSSGSPQFGFRFKFDNLTAGSYTIKFKAYSMASVARIVYGLPDNLVTTETGELEATSAGGTLTYPEFEVHFTLDEHTDTVYFSIYPYTAGPTIYLLDIQLFGTESAAVASIKQYVDDSMASISLNVTGALGDTASIVMTAGGKTYTESLDLTKVREAFANDNSSIEISAGTVAFLSNTLIIASKCLELDASGNLTIDTNQFQLTNAGNATFSGTLSAPSGNIGGWTIGTSSLYNGTSSITSTTNGTYIGTNGIRQYNSGDYMNITSAVIMNGNTNSNNYVELYNAALRFYNSGTYLGYYGTSTWEGTTQQGLVINSEYKNNFTVFGRKTSSSADVYTADYLINYNLGSSVIGYSEKHLFYGSARFTGSVSGISAASLTVEGNIYNTGEYYSASDTKVKVDVNDMLDKVDSDDVIDNLEPVTYRLKDYDDGKLHMGLTYQNVKEAIEADGMDPDDMAILSSMKDRNGDEIGMIAYSELIPVLISEIQTLKKEVKSLKSGNA